MKARRILFHIFVIFLIVSCGNNSTSLPNALYSIDTDGDNLTVILSDPTHEYWGAAWSPDGLKVAFLYYELGSKQQELYLADADGSNVIQLTNNGRINYQPAWSPDGELISFLSKTDEKYNGTTEIYSIQVNGNHEARLTNNNAFEYGQAGLLMVKKSLLVLKEAVTGRYTL